MPTTQENIQFLYLVLTQGGPPTIDWDPVCAALQLGKGAATKRWSRLKQAIDKGEKPADSNYELLWLMMKHSAGGKSHDWDAIARACNSTKGACSKRYSRLHIAFEKGDAPVSAASTPQKTPAKAKVKAKDGERTATPTPKRKRTPAKKAPSQDHGTEDEDEDDAKPKRAKSTPKAKPKNGFRASDQEGEDCKTHPMIKTEPVEDDGDIFFDAAERAAAEGDAVLPRPPCLDTFTQARELANVLLDEEIVLEHHEDLQHVLDDTAASWE